jgi:protein gp37
VHQEVKWSHNIWMGVSVEDARVVERIQLLRQTAARVKFLSLEPLIGPLYGLDLTKIDWVIVGGESGHRPRPMEADWALDIQEQCQHAGVAFFFKQWGGRNKKAAGRVLNGRTYDEMPAHGG